MDGNKVLIQYHVKNNDSKDMPFGFGLHPAFKLDDEFSTYTLDFETEENVKQRRKYETIVV